MKGDWLPLIVFCFTGAILSKVSKTKFSNESYDIFLPVLKQAMRNVYSFIHYQNVYSHDYLRIVVSEACFKNRNYHFTEVR